MHIVWLHGILLFHFFHFFFWGGGGAYRKGAKQLAGSLLWERKCQVLCPFI